MLDTIALTLNQSEFQVTDMAIFSPSAQGLIAPPYYSLGARGNFSCYQNPTKADFERGIYKPRLTLTKRKAHVGFAITLRCEFSAPKLLYGNNFDELREADFEHVVDTLHSRLTEMGIHTTKDVLRKVSISAIHYSKNVPLTDYANCAMVLNELRKINLTQRLDLSHTDYRNEGHAIRYHANSYEIAFYDKIKDMQQAKVSEKRALEKDYIIQRDLFPKKGKSPLEVLRMEVRLGNRTKIKALLKTIDADCLLDFESLFKESISKAILLHFWHAITKDMPLLALSHFKPEDIYYALMKEAKGTAKPAKLLQQIGALALLQNVGMRGLHSLVSTHSNARTWQRIKRELEKPALANTLKYSATRNVTCCLEAFEPVKIDRCIDLQFAGKM